MFLVFIPGVGIHEGGASRWANILGFSFQPSEFLKLTTIIYLSAFLSSEKIKKPFLNFCIIISFIILALFAQSDLSTLITIFITTASYFLFCQYKNKRHTYDWGWRPCIVFYYDINHTL